MKLNTLTLMSVTSLSFVSLSSSATFLIDENFNAGTANFAAGTWSDVAATGTWELTFSNFTQFSSNIVRIVPGGELEVLINGQPNSSLHSLDYSFVYTADTGTSVDNLFAASGYQTSSPGVHQNVVFDFGSATGTVSDPDNQLDELDGTTMVDEVNVRNVISGSTAPTWEVDFGSSVGVSGGTLSGVYSSTGAPNIQGEKMAFNISASATAAPEPSSMVLLGLGGLVLITRRRK